MNISGIKDCYGCGVCATVCARQIIDIALNENGFLEPRITDEGKCTNCRLCVDVCSYSHKELSLKASCVKSFAAWSKDAAVRRKCSSGGVGFEVGRTLIGEGYKVCGVRYNAERNRAEHYVATTIEELIPSIGSKYIQSYTVDGFKAIDRNEKYLVTGTPCQIDSFRRYLQKFKKEDNFVLLDFFCHGVPSKLMWDKYVHWAEKQVGSLTYVSWRNKFTGWHDSWAMAIDGSEKGESVKWHESYNLSIREKKSFLNTRLSQGDMFYRLFLSDACLGKACYEKCKFKYENSSADIRIGDLWGTTYQDDEKGISGAIAFTDKGNNLLMKANLECVEHPLSVVAEGQMKECAHRPFFYKKLMTLLKDNSLDIEVIMLRSGGYLKWKRLRERLMNPSRTARNLIRRFRK